jgi:hypothetical protein
MIGICSGFYTTTGSSNIFFGKWAGYCVTTGTNNILIGCHTGFAACGGLATISTESNRIIMGNSSHTCAQIQIGWSVVSDVRDKCIFGPVPYGRGFLNQINPITYSFKDRISGELTDDKRRYGFSAQEILNLEGNDPILVGTGDPNKLNLTTDYMIPILVNAVKELDNELASLKNENQNLKERLTLIEQKIN